MSSQPLTLKSNDNGELSLGDIPLTTLAKDYGTPLYVMDEQTIRHNCQSYTRPLSLAYPNHQVLYAGKANLNIGLANIMVDEGLGLDVVSGGELYTALQTQVDRSNIYFHGNNKNDQELALAIEHNIKIVVDHDDEIQTIASLCPEGSLTQIMIRLKPEIEAHTHDYIKTGQIDSKFGIDQKNLVDTVKLIQHHKNLKFIGIHSHIGSQIFDVKPFEELTTLMVGHLKTLQDTLNISVEELNLGGGIGIKYTEKDNPLDLHPFVTKIAALLLSECKKAKLPPPKLLMEPGRSIVGNAGLTLYQVGAIKDIPNIKTYVFVDGGMADNPRPIIYQAKYTFGVANPANPSNTKTYSIAGKFCESGDILAENIDLPQVSKGDIIVVYGTGAYNYSMSSNYNRACRPAMICIHNGTVKELVRRESFEDLVQLDVH